MGVLAAVLGFFGRGAGMREWEVREGIPPYLFRLMGLLSPSARRMEYRR